MHAVPVSGALGAEIVDVDVRGLDDAGFEALRKLLHEHEVVFIRGVDFTDDEHIAFARRFGPLRIFPIAKLLGATEPQLQVIADGPDSPPEADDWHTDVTWVAEPPDYAVLRGTVVPERGGDTLWASMTAAYEALSAPIRVFLDGLTVRHDNTVFIDAVERKAPDMCEQFDVPNRLRTEYPGVEHPLVRTHPDTGRKSLFLGGDFIARYRRAARRRERNNAWLPAPAHRRRALPLPLAVDRRRRRSLGRTLDEPPQRGRPLPAAPRAPPQRSRRRPPALRAARSPPRSHRGRVLAR